MVEQRQNPTAKINSAKLSAVLVCFALFFLSAFDAQAATLSLYPPTGSFTTQNNVTLSINLNTDQAINGVEGLLHFPANKLEVVSISKSRSVMSLWVQEPTFSNAGQTGVVQFSAIKLNPGYVGSKGNILDIVFRVKDAGVANVTFASGSVLANDGRGSNLLTAFGSSVLSLSRSAISPTITVSQNKTPAVSSGQTPNSYFSAIPLVKYWTQDRAGKDVLFNTSDADPKWSNLPYAKMTWNLPADIIGVSTKFDDNPDTEPASKSSLLTDNQTLPMLSEGKHYFHIRFITNSGAGPVLHIPLLIDLNEPKHFSVEFSDTIANSQGIFSTSNPRPRVIFFTEDSLSGIDKYEYKLNDSDWSAVELERDGTFVLPKLDAEKRYDLIVRAYDAAGNYVDGSASINITPIVSPRITSYPKNFDQSDGSLIVEGHSAPGAAIQLVLSAGNPLVATTKADDNGDWRLVYDKTLPTGTYKVSAKQILDNGAESGFSEPVTIRANLWTGKIWIYLQNYSIYLAIILIFLLCELTTYAFYRRALKRLKTGQSAQNNLNRQ